MTADFVGKMRMQPSCSFVPNEQQAGLAERTGDLRRSNASKADLKQHLRAEYERQKERGIDLAARTQELQKNAQGLGGRADAEGGGGTE